MQKEGATRRDSLKADDKATRASLPNLPIRLSNIM